MVQWISVYKDVHEIGSSMREGSRLMAISLPLPRARFAVWVRSLSLHPYRPQGLDSKSPEVVSLQRPFDEHPRPVIPPANLYSIESEEEEPTWEDAEWQ